MKILLAVHCFFPRHVFGTETMTLSLAKGLKARGHDVTVLTIAHPSEGARADAPYVYAYENIPVWAIDGGGPSRSLAQHYHRPKLTAQHLAVLDQLKPDLLHVTHLMGHTSALLDAAKARKIPVFATLTDYYGICANSRLEKPSGKVCAGPGPLRVNCVSCALKDLSQDRHASTLRRVAGLGGVRQSAALAAAMAGAMLGPKLRYKRFRPADVQARPAHLRAAFADIRGALAPCASTADAFRRNGHGYPIVVTPFGVDIERRKPSSAPRKGPLRAGMIGQIAPHKGVHVLIDALMRLPRGQVAGRIYGDLRQYPDYADAQQQRATGHDIRFLAPFGPEFLSKALRDLDVLCVPSLWTENSPLIALQALASGVPVIASDVPGLSSVLKPGAGSLLVKRGDARAWAAALSGLAEDRGALAQLAAGARYDKTGSDMAADALDLYRRYG